MQNSAEEPTSPHWHMIRDLAVLQVKLVVDGFRDVLLLPASIIAALISVFNTENGVPGPQFYKLLAVGKQSEQWINLFGALRNAPAGVDRVEGFGETDLDSIFSRLESFVVAEYKRGGVTAQAKSRIDEALRAMRKTKEKEQREADT